MIRNLWPGTRRDGAPERAAARPETAAAWTTDREILGYLRTSDMPALVRGNGAIVATRAADPRMVRSLKALVRSRLGHAEIPVETVSPIDFRRLQDGIRAEHRSGSRQEELVQAGNQTVEYILGQAIDAQASDLYLDIRRDTAILSFRVYGSVQRAEEMTPEIARNVARGLYRQSGTGQWEESGPCDTAFSFEHRDRTYRIRCNSVKDVRGSSLSCRIRDPGFVLPLGESGYSEHQTTLIRRICNAPGGLVLMSGETGSGKSTTLASLMRDAPRSQRMIEIADPVEVEFDHCTHVELDHYREDAGELFRDIMAAIVRQNPDSLILGEIRDELTARAAMTMAIQGKRVFSTLHTQSCVAAIPRLASLGVDPHLLTLREFIAGIVNQNLVPLTCPQCALDTHPDPARDARYRELFGDVRYINPEGCAACRGGVTGQTLVAEVYPLYLDRREAHQIIARKELFRLAEYMQREHGVETKQEHARAKVAAGLVDPQAAEEIIGEWSLPECAEADA